MRVLVTGGAGYIGSHTCKALAKRGHTPIVLDNLVNGHRDFVKWGPFYEGDIRDRQLVQKIVEQEKIDAAIHFAAFAYVGESMREPAKYYDNNVRGTFELIEGLRATSVRRVVFSSSCATYGNAVSLPMLESDPQNPINPYGWTKLMGEHLFADYSKAYDFNVTCLRYFNAAGADPELEIGEWHEPETHLIPLALQAAFNGTTFKIFGSNYETEDGTCLRDYIHVSDLARAHVMAVERKAENGWEALNLGTGRGATILQVLHEIEEFWTVKIDAQRTEARPGDPPALVAAAGLAKEMLGWEPQFSDLRTIIQTAGEWLRKHEAQKV